MKYSTEKELAIIFSKLRDIGFTFSGGEAGWPPAAIFEELRDRGLLQGKFVEIMWMGKGKIISNEK